MPRGLRIYGELCGWALARAHAWSGDRIAIAAYLGSSDAFDQAITQFAPRTPTRTNATTRNSSTPSPQDGSPPNPTCKIPPAAQQWQERKAMTAVPPESLVTEGVRSLEVRRIFPGQRGQVAGASRGRLG